MPRMSFVLKLFFLKPRALAKASKDLISTFSSTYPYPETSSTIEIVDPPRPDLADGRDKW